MSKPRPGPMTLDEYDRLTPPEGEQYELHDGYLVAFSTGTGTHGILCTRISTALDSHVRQPCHVFGAGAIGVRRADRATSVVPDGVAICEEFDLASTYVTAPKLVVVVISPKSVNRDRVQKLDVYRAFPSIDEYLMLDSRRVWACVYRRAPGGAWLDVVYDMLEARIDLLSVDLRIGMADLYRGIEPRKPRIKVNRTWLIRLARTLQYRRATSVNGQVPPVCDQNLDRYSRKWVFPSFGRHASISIDTEM